MKDYFRKNSIVRTSRILQRGLGEIGYHLEIGFPE